MGEVIEFSEYVMQMSDMAPGSRFREHKNDPWWVVVGICYHNDTLFTRVTRGNLLGRSDMVSTDWRRVRKITEGHYEAIGT